MAVYRKSLLTNQLKYNFNLWANSKLLDAGYWRNIRKGETDHKGNNLSKFYLDSTNSAFPSGLVWKGLKSNWVFEGDIERPSGAPSVINPSGVYINDVFKLPNDAVYPHYFNLNDGKVIFTGTTKVSSASKVEVEYTYKEVGIYIPNEEQLFNLHNDFFANDDIKDTGFPFNRISTPAVFIEVDSENDFQPLALGGGKSAFKKVFLHLVSNNQFKHVISDIADLFSYQQFSTITILDIDKLFERLLFNGIKSPDYNDYKNYLVNEFYHYNLAFIKQADPVTIETQIRDYNRIRIDMLLEIRGVS